MLDLEPLRRILWDLNDRISKIEFFSIQVDHGPLFDSLAETHHQSEAAINALQLEDL